MTKHRYNPDQLLARYRAIRDGISLEEFFRRPAHQKTQEMWCAAHFGRAYAAHVGPCAILIDETGSDSDVDFELEYEDRMHPFQITEVQQPGRKRGDEYKEPVASVAREDDWTSGSQSGHEWIRDAIEKKLKKSYAGVSGLNLLVYVNFPALSQDYVRIRDTSAGATSAFASVWLLNGNALCCLQARTELPSFEFWRAIPESLAYDEP